MDLNSVNGDPPTGMLGVESHLLKAMMQILWSPKQPYRFSEAISELVTCELMLL